MHVAVGELRIERDRFPGRLLHLLAIRQKALSAGVEVRQHQGRLGKSGPGRSVMGVQLEGSQVSLAGVQRPLPGVPVEELFSQQELAVRFGAGGAVLAGRRPFAGQEPDLQRPDHRGRDLVLDGEDRGQLAVEGLRPEVDAGRGVDQLGAHAQASAGDANATGEDRIHL